MHRPLRNRERDRARHGTCRRGTRRRQGSEPDNPLTEIFIVQANGRAPAGDVPRCLGRSMGAARPVWSPDGGGSPWAVRARQRCASGGVCGERGRHSQRSIQQWLPEEFQRAVRSPNGRRLLYSDATPARVTAGSGSRRSAPTRCDASAGCSSRLAPYGKRIAYVNFVAGRVPEPQRPDPGGLPHGGRTDGRPEEFAEADEHRLISDGRGLDRARSVGCCSPTRTAPIHGRWRMAPFTV